MTARFVALAAGLGLAACAGGETTQGNYGYPPGAPSGAMDEGESGGVPPGDDGLPDGGTGLPDDDGALESCCQRHDSPGCNEEPVNACVCDVEPMCCDVEWAQLCVEIGVEFGCLDCGEQAPDEGQGPCCEASGVPGCIDPEVALCVCETEDFCCTGAWDAACVALVETLECGACSEGEPGDAGDDGEAGGSEGGEEPDPDPPDEPEPDPDPPPEPEPDPDPPPMPPPDPPDPGNACCSPSDTPGCGNPIVELCVCLDDPFCCFFAWDATCVEEVTSLSCGSC